MTTTIIYAHPYAESLNHAVLLQVQEVLQSQNEPYKVLDLYQDHFNPAYTTEELRLFHIGQTTDPLVSKYQAAIQHSQRLIFIFPIWWNDLPAIVKGFLDKVFKLHFAYVNSNYGVQGQLQHIQQVQLLTTSTSPTWYLKLIAGNAVQSVFAHATLKQAGIKHVHWHNCSVSKLDWRHFGQLTQRPRHELETYLQQISI
ncbi:NAD(P)H-dependent oxidoreductase [Bombilactobacillus folatiphilus]|uniref:NAD(P)H-dependent oxidoreductase n=1 Tax=Bombilactobacillus folatiphilus TaxID=2923362 RepID=A0ABY4P6Y0_9LACO|nr:NAD(P)H-dependent oxidoreductase [Bombilactobacillus folatiphilus]UQS81443.1 NAD(P)H-dependent oxidoreductase [Bombilactobacillus folatiphilus]